jgi:hypothetical protein
LKENNLLQKVMLQIHVFFFDCNLISYKNQSDIIIIVNNVDDNNVIFCFINCTIMYLFTISQ